MVAEIGNGRKGFKSFTDNTSQVAVAFFSSSWSEFLLPP